MNPTTLFKNLFRAFNRKSSVFPSHNISFLCLKSVILLQKVKKVRQLFDKNDNNCSQWILVPVYFSSFSFSLLPLLWGVWNTLKRILERHWDRGTWTCAQEVQVSEKLHERGTRGRSAMEEKLCQLWKRNERN